VDVVRVGAVLTLSSAAPAGYTLASLAGYAWRRRLLAEVTAAATNIAIDGKALSP
jgi:hypothetical protein